MYTGVIMCDFYLQGKCFHPNKVPEGQIATTCQAHACQVCTSAKWQAKVIAKEKKQYEEHIVLAGGNLQRVNHFIHEIGNF